MFLPKVRASLLKVGATLLKVGASLPKVRATLLKVGASLPKVRASLLKVRALFDFKIKCLLGLFNKRCQKE